LTRREVAADGAAGEPAADGDDAPAPCDACGRYVPLDDVLPICLECLPTASRREEREVKQSWLARERGLAPFTESEGCDRCGREYPAPEVRYLCTRCRAPLGPPGTAAPLPADRLRASLPAREIRRRTGRGRCVDLCGRPREGASPRCGPCGKIHRRELARRRQLNHRSRGGGALQEAGEEPEAVTQPIERAPAPARRRDGGGGTQSRDTESGRIGGRVFGRKTAAPSLGVNLTARHSTYARSRYGAETKEGGPPASQL